jgi:phosphoheptose isomerase
MSGVSFSQDLAELEALFSQCRAELEPQVLEVAGTVISALQQGGKLLICGNGGSAADSQHLAAELVSSFMLGLNRRALPAIALTTDTSILTAYSNDFDFAHVFARQVEALGDPRDVLLGISTSGSSVNVLKAVTQAKAVGMATVALTGGDGGALAKMVDAAVVVPSENTQDIQTVHLVVEHFLCAAIEAAVMEGSL